MDVYLSSPLLLIIENKIINYEFLLPSRLNRLTPRNSYDRRARDALWRYRWRSSVLFLGDDRMAALAWPPTGSSPTTSDDPL